MTKISKLAIIDGHYFLFRSYSVPFKFHSKNGTPLHVVTTYLKLLRQAASILDLTTDDKIIVVFDTPTSNSNFKLSKDYKSNRKQDYSQDEDSPFAHLPHIQSVLSKLSIKFTEIRNHEADDVVATIARKYGQIKDQLVYIFSADSDFYQLLNDKIRIVHLKRKGEHEVVSHLNLNKKIGVKPIDYVYYKCLIGDKADNIKGVENIGPVRARKIVNGELVIDLKPHSAELKLNKKLITLNSSVKKAMKLDNFYFNDLLLKLSNREIFELCEF